MTGRVALAATPGGHIDEAFEIADRFAGREDRFFITAQTPQTEALLAAERVEWVPEVRSRQGLRAVQSLTVARRLLREHRPRLLISTGAALTVPYLIVARLSRLPVVYVESATRLEGPSVTGRICELLPGAGRFYQAEGWQRRGWESFGSVFDGYIASAGPARPVRDVLVSVGSEQFPFRRAIEAVRASSAGLHLAWQTGNTPVSAGELPGEVRAWWPGDELAARARAADVVVVHAGVGSILMALRAGSCPVVIPRTKQFGEHVDDHQGELARLLEQRGLVVVARSGDDISHRLREAAERQVRKRVSSSTV